jgi:hypothetical protein
VLAFLVVIGTPGTYFANKYWPYRYRNVEPMLETVFASRIKIDHYHRIYFPSPGFVASGLTLRRNTAPNLPPLGTARDLIVQGSWIDLLLMRERVQLVDVKGLHIMLPAVGSEGNREDFPPGSSADFAGPATTVEELRLHDAVLDILRTNGGRYSFPIRQLVIRNLQKGKTMTYAVDMQNAMPTGRIQAKGSFGPLVPKNLGATPLSDDFTFSPVNLGDIKGISGTLSSTGRFRGTLAAIEAEAKSDTPDFAVGKGKPTDVKGSIQCTIDGLNGGVVLHQVEVEMGATRVQVQGAILGSPKVTELDIAVKGGRAQDLLRPFLHDAVPISGGVSLHSHVRLEPAKNGAKFLKRLRVDGSFDVPEERLTNRATEEKLSAFSRRAQGIEQTESDADSGSDVVSSLRGDLKIRDGILTTQRIAFQMPGAEADVNGSWNLRDKNVRMTGNVRMESDISHVTTGFKSMLLKPLVPFFKRKHAGAVIPIAITGGPGSYKVTQNIAHTK